MQKFIGVKIILAMAMTVGQAMRDHGVKLSPDPSGKDRQDDEQGYLVEYDNGYKSWSPKDVFDAAYRLINGMTFGLAIEALKRGHKVARAGWNGKGMWLALVLPYTEAVHSGDKSCFCYRAFELPDGANGSAKKSPNLLPYIAMKTVGDDLVPWLASQTDMLAEDWMIV